MYPARTKDRDGETNMDGPRPVRELYSALHFLLEERGLSVADLAGQIKGLGEAVDARTLNRLADPDRPIKQVDARVVDLICRALGVEIGTLFAFAEPLASGLKAMPPAHQERLTALMERHTEEELRGRELAELRSLVAEASDVELFNLRQLVDHRDRLREAIAARRHAAAD